MMEATLMLFPFICSIVYREKVGIYFLFVAIFMAVIGALLSKIFTSDIRFYSAEGFITASLGWVVLSLFGSLPFFLSKEIPSFVDALFETISGFSTTGATILTDVTKLSKCMNFWRCLTHFVGGMGILVLVIAFLPTKSENMNILKAESPGPQVGKIVPKVSDTAKTLYIIYISLTLLAIMSYKLSGMPIYDSICIGLGTAGTGGFVVTKNGCADYSILSQTLICIFMLIFSLNFNLFYLILLKKWKDVLHSEELRVFFGIVVISIILIVINSFKYFANLYEAIHNVSFQVASIISTTGFSTFDYTVLPTFSQNMLLLLMIIGGCAGSTAGGLKVSRVIITFKCIINEIYLQLHPNSVRVIKCEDKIVPNSIVRTTNTYFIIYFVIILFGILLISFDDLDFPTTVSSVFETFNNIGLGLSKIGPKGNFSIFNNISKFVFMFLMLTGRLEIFPIIMLISVNTWRREK